MKFFLIGFLFVFTSIINAQLNIIWETETNANSYHRARAQEIKYDSEGNTILAGYSWYGIYNSNQTVFVAKIDQDGNIIWLQRYMGDDIGEYDNGTVNGLYLDSEDNIILFAKYFSQKVIKYDKDGNFISMDDYIFDLPITINVYNNDILFDKVHKDPSGNYHLGGIITDYNYSTPKVYSYYAQFTPQGEYWKHKTDSLNVLQYHMGPSRISYYEDFNVHLVGNGSIGEYPNATGGVAISRINTEGDCTWGDINLVDDYERYPMKMLRSNDGHIYVASFYNSSDGWSRGAYLSKYDPAGALVWEQKIDTIQVDNMEFDNGGNIWLIGSGTSSSVVARIKYSTAGERLIYKLDENSYLADNLLVNDKNEIYYVVNNSGGVFVQKFDWQGELIDEVKISTNYNFLLTTILTFDPNGDLIVCSDWQEKIYIKKIADNSVDVKENQITPIIFSLEQNYPNPFNPSTVISYQIPVNSLVELKVFDMLGREVTSLVNEEQTAGTYTVQFDAPSLSSGIYFYTLKTNDYFKTKKMMLIK